MKKYKWPLNKCLEFLINKKQDIDIPNYFMDQLKNFEGRMIKRGEGIIKFLGLKKIYFPLMKD